MSEVIRVHLTLSETDGLIYNVLRSVPPRHRAKVVRALALYALLLSESSGDHCAPGVVEQNTSAESSPLPTTPGLPTSLKGMLDF